MMDWGWTSYGRTGWARDDADGKRKEYRAHFSTVRKPGESWEECSVTFRARHPIQALRDICDSGKHPLEFHGQDVN